MIFTESGADFFMSGNFIREAWLEEKHVAEEARKRESMSYHWPKQD